MFFILKNIVNMEKTVEKYKRNYHGSLSLDTIYLTEEGQIKFLDPFLLESHHTPYEKHMLGLLKIPLPPELIHSMQSNIPNPNCDPKKVEIWMIGIFLLSLMSLVDPSYFYDWNTNSLKTGELDLMRNQVTRLYSPLLVRTITKCLELSPVKRCSLRDIEQALMYYHDN